MKRLAIVTTHPIQYYAPLFRLLAQRQNIVIKVFYTWGEQAKTQVYDPGFGATREWDIPLLDGYDYEFVENISKEPGSSHYYGIINPNLIKQIKNYDADAVLVFGWAFKSHLKLLRYFKGKIPVYFRGDSTLLDEPAGFSVSKIIRRIFLTWVYRHIDVAFYVGTNNYEYYRVHGVKEKNLVYAPHVIDNQRFQNNYLLFEKQASQLKDKLNIPKHKIAVLFAGKFEAKKNPLLMVNAARLLPHIHFILVGNGKLETEIAKSCAVISNITILPFQNQSKMPVIYRLADVFVLPSQGPGETWGLAINEAMACGRAIIASKKCGGAIDLINGNGFIINPNLDDLVFHLKKFTYETIATFKQASIDQVKKFSLQNVAAIIEQSVLTFEE